MTQKAGIKIRRILSGSAVSLALLPLHACFLSSKSSNLRGSASYIDGSATNFVRRSDNLTRSNLSLELRTIAFCKYTLVAQERLFDISESSTIFKPCHGESAEASYKLEFENLSRSTLYAVGLKLWQSGQSEDQAKLDIVYEKKSKNMGNLVATYFNIPAQNGEYQFVSERPGLNIADFYQTTRPYAGCRLSTNHEARFLPPFYLQPNLSELQLNLGGAIIASATNSTSLLFNGIDHSRDLSAQWNYNGQKTLLKTKSPGQITKLTLSAQESVDLTQNLENPQNLKIKTGENLEIRWATNHTSEQSFIKLSFNENSATTPSLVCYFDAEAQSATIDYKQYLSQLTPGAYISQASYVYQIADLFSANDTWLISSHDWRTFSLERI